MPIIRLGYHLATNFTLATTLATKLASQPLFTGDLAFRNSPYLLG